MARLMPNNLLRQPNFGAIVVLAWLLVALTLLLQYWAQTAETLLDPDDAMRLVEVRTWLAGQGWFDMHIGRVQPPTGYDLHWSRLIDAGLGGLYVLFQYFDPRIRRAADAGLVAARCGSCRPWLARPRSPGASPAARLRWWRCCWRLPACRPISSSRPGRIDHHNVQIALTVLIAAATVWSDRKSWCRGHGWPADRFCARDWL